MSMTREEAIKHLLHDWHINLGCEFAIKPGRLDDFLAAMDVALTALRPVSREQVEKVWRGEWRLDEEKSKKHVEPIYVCTRCENFEAWGDTEKTNFCGFCGAPMTDEAVQMVSERLEALKDGSTTD